MIDKILKALEIYISYCERNNVEWLGSHSEALKLGIGAYIPQSFTSDKSYAILKAYGIEFNVNGQVGIKYGKQAEIFPIDFVLWVETAIDTLVREAKKEEATLADFKLAVPEKLELTRGEYFNQANQVKAKILDDLLKRNVGFNK